MPVQYREAQSNFFGKRELSWHVSVCPRKVGGNLESQTFIHILQTGLQDSTAVVLIMDHVLRSLTMQRPEIDCSFFSGKTMPDTIIQHKPYCQWISCRYWTILRYMSEIAWNILRVIYSFVKNDAWPNVVQCVRALKIHAIMIKLLWEYWCINCVINRLDVSIVPKYWWISVLPKFGVFLSSILGLYEILALKERFRSSRIILYLNVLFFDLLS